MAEGNGEKQLGRTITRSEFSGEENACDEGGVFAAIDIYNRLIMRGMRGFP